MELKGVDQDHKDMEESGFQSSPVVSVLWDLPRGPQENGFPFCTVQSS